MAGESSDGRFAPSERRTDLAVMDANEFKQKHRLERILVALDNIEEQANKAWDGFVHGDISHDAKNIMIQRAVKQAIREAYNLLQDHQRSLETDESGDKILQSDYWIGSEDRGPIGTIPMRDGDDIVIWGLRDLLQTDEFYRERWEKTVKPRNRPEKTVVKEREVSVPESVSWDAALRLKEFLDSEHDLEVKFEELDDSLPNWGYQEVDDVPEDVEVI